jgi:hypothetical protein
MSPMITISPAITLNIVTGRHNDRAIENIVTDFAANALPGIAGNRRWYRSWSVYIDSGSVLRQ